MLKFLATTENTRKKIRRTELQLRQSSQKKRREIAIRNFQCIIRTRVELTLSWQKTESNREWRKEKLCSVDQSEPSVER